tara:strand:+ start:773 stop:982 length:210 start_codon:yes stop_codon:yes gene_type:complete
MKIDLEAMEAIRDTVRSTAYLIENEIKEIGGETLDKVQPHVLDLYEFVKDLASGSGKFEVRSNDDAFDK